MTIAVVTGANGFIGRHLCSALHARGWQLRVVTRGAAPPHTHKLDVTLASGGDALARALSGADVVYHLAAIAHERLAAADPHTLAAVNVEATERVMRAADRAAVPQLVWLSSIKVLGDVSRRPLRTNDPYHPQDAYARSKVRAEQALQDCAAQHTHLALVRPPLVYGAWVGGNFLRLLAWVAKGLPLPLGSARAPRSLLGVANLCDLLARLSEPCSGIFHVADREDLGVAELVMRVAAALGRPARLVAVPPRLLGRVARLVGREALHSRLFDALQVDQSETAAALGWCPPHDTHTQLQETASWYLRRP